MCVFLHVLRHFKAVLKKSVISFLPFFLTCIHHVSLLLQTVQLMTNSNNEHEKKEENDTANRGVEVRVQRVSGGLLSVYK